MNTPIQGFILAAGLGTRMGPLSLALPKPAWTLRGRPLIQWSADTLRAAGLSRIACNVHHRAEELQALAEDLSVFHEAQLLGSSGGLTHVRDCAANPLAVWNADALGEVPWAAFIQGHHTCRAQLSWLLVPHPGGPWNPVWLSSEGLVQPPGVEGEGPYHFTGAALWGAEALALLPRGASDTKRDLLPRLTRHCGVVVAAFPWREVGTPDQLIAAAAEVAPEQEGRRPGCYLHPQSEGGPGLRRCVLGPGVRLDPTFEDRDAFWFLDEGQPKRLPLDWKP